MGISVKMLKEEMEAVANYSWCASKATDPALVAILKEEMEAEKMHASALLRYINNVAPAALA